jgi:hypothetical protein
MPQSLVKFGGRSTSTTLPLDARAESAASGKVLHRLLIVEDDAMVGILLCDVLGKDYDVVHVASSKEALRALADQRRENIPPARRWKRSRASSREFEPIAAVIRRARELAGADCAQRHVSGGD